MRPLAIVVALLVLLSSTLLVIGWIFSGAILVPERYHLMPEFEIADVRPVEGRSDVWEVELPSQPEDATQFSRTEVEGRYGLLWEGGAGRLGPVTRRGPDGVVRTVSLSRGGAPTPGAPARMDVVLYGPDPSSRALSFEDVRIPGPLGDLPGWWIPGREDDAILVLHGRRRADRTETLRILPTLVSDGASVLVSSYRNHDASPPSADGYYHYGATEVEDVLAAVRWLEARGARRIVLMGFSMGGSLAVEAIEHWDAALGASAGEAAGGGASGGDATGGSDRARAVGLILDSPLLDPAPVFRHVAVRQGLPLPNVLTPVAMGIASLRAGIAWDEVDARRAAPQLDLPVLLIAGTADGTIPIGLVDDFALRLPRDPIYLRMDGVEHVEGWNVAPDRYEAAVADFLRSTFGGDLR